ncbi:uncharacterized protein [Aegilops tauschii subsp. strangulata]|uniref:uncharacterized protein isoform X1 n=1 Tax=Aegilops tauschii subsp. strangulata TaxID=200361 RepID=UPI001ABCEFBE|nr:uncharacterized protein LOC109740265 isoform X2 [Aegilops tauschii subsp. strangulata]
MRGARTSCSSTSIPQHRRKRCPASSTAGASYLPHERPRRRAAAGAVADETPQCRVVTPLVSEPEAPAELARWWLRCMWEIGSVLNFLHVRVPFLPSYPQRPADRRTGSEIELKELEPSTRLLILKAICDIRVEIVRKLISLCREAIQGHEASKQVCAATCYCTNSLDRAPCSRRCWLSNLQCNPSLCRCLNHFVLLHNQQNIAAAAIYPLISWSDPNLGKPATCASNRKPLQLARTMSISPTVLFGMR